MARHQIMMKPLHTELSAKVSQIPRHQVAEIWPFAKGFVEAACHRSSGSLISDELYRRCLKDLAQLWVVWKDLIYGACITKLSRSPDGLECTIIAYGAQGLHRGEWLHLIKDVERWASQEGCTAMEIYGRRGWSRLLDYKTTKILDRNRIIMCKDL